MRFVKLGLISVVFFFLLMTGISLLLPSTTNISRAIDINAPAGKVFSYINDVKKWKEWYANYDSSNVSFSPVTVGKGASFTINRTNITLTEILPGKIKATWQTAKNEPVEGEFDFIPKEAGASITLHWNLVQKVKWYPWQKVASIVTHKTIAPFMERSLENLKKVGEKP
jgi:uncharacterized protein YndB with AHSA1/START domain